MEQKLSIRYTMAFAFFVASFGWLFNFTANNEINKNPGIVSGVYILYILMAVGSALLLFREMNNSKKE